MIQFELVLYDAESSSQAVCVNAGNFRGLNNVVFSNHIDPVGFALTTMKRIELQMILIESTEDTTRYHELTE